MHIFKTFCACTLHVEGTCFQINCNGHQIKSQSSITYLSIDIDQH
jgi:hypothetical protein